MSKLILIVCLALLAAACAADDGGEAPAASSTSEGPDATATPSSAVPTSSSLESSTTSSTATPPGLAGGSIAFSGQGNDLVAYDLDGNRRLVIQNAGDDPEGLDINGQICFLDDRTFVAGEDTGQPEIVPGWGIFELEGDALDELTATQVGKLVPTYQPAESQPEMFGCGVMADGRVVVTDVGNQASGPGTGQLIVFFPPIEGTEVPFCIVDPAITTAQQIQIDGENALVASARPPTLGIRRYTNLPAGVDECTATDVNGSPAVVDPPEPELFIDPADGGVGISNGIAPAPDGGWYVSSVLTGVIAQFDVDGTFMRTILAPPADETLGPEPFSTGTPNGLGVTADGTLWFADLGLVRSDSGIGPGPGIGTVRVIRFVDGEPQPPETIDENLRFPDAIGILPGGDE